MKIIFIFIAMTLMANFSAASDATIKIGVLAKRGTERCLEKWSSTAKYLTNKIPGKTFIIVPLDFEDIYPAVENSVFDYDVALGLDD